MNGRWKEGVEALDTSIATFAACRGVRWEIETAQMLRYDALYWMGEWERMGRELPTRRTGRRAARRSIHDQHCVRAIRSRLVAWPPTRYDRARKKFDDSCSLLPEGAFALLRTARSLQRHRPRVLRPQSFGRTPSSDRSVAEAGGDVSACGRTAESRLLFYRARIALALAAQANNQSAAEQALARALGRCRHSRSRGAVGRSPRVAGARHRAHARQAKIRASPSPRSRRPDGAGGVPHAPLRCRGRFPPRDAHGQRRGARSRAIASDWMTSQNDDERRENGRPARTWSLDEARHPAMTRVLRRPRCSAWHRPLSTGTRRRAPRPATLRVIVSRRFRAAPSGRAHRAGARRNGTRAHGTDRTRRPRHGVCARDRPLHSARRA